MKQDYLVRGIAADGMLRVNGAITTNTCNEAAKRHGTWPIATAALGRLLTGAIMMGAMLLKDDQRMMLQVRGDGPLREIVAVTDGHGHVKGYVGEPHVHFPLNDEGKLDVARAIGQGRLTVTRQIGDGEPYLGNVPLLTGEIGDDLAYYFARSEQVPSVVSLGVLVETDNSVRAAGGYILQVMPGASEEIISFVESKAQNLAGVSRSIDAGHTPEEILTENFGELGLEFLETTPVSFVCDCTRDRFERALLSLGREELESLLADQGQAETVCQFCGAKYLFSRQDVERLVEIAKQR
ncbi:MAG: Hsp33 family molecular chaperone HslO [Firmicutes bacterium]|nr:Hsp33 family molecular chaperone HslO [Bacillota bacterium]